MRKVKKQGLLLGSVILISAAIIGKVAGLIYKIPLTNILGGSGMGYYSSAYTVFGPLYSIFAGSLSSAVTWYISSGRDRQESLGGVTKGCFIVFGLSGLITSILTAALSGFTASKIIGNTEAKYAIAAISPCIFIEAITAVYRGYFEGRQNMLPTATSQAIEATSRIIFGLGFIFMAKTDSTAKAAAAAIWGVTASNLASLAYLVIRAEIHKDERQNFGRGKSDYRAVKLIVKAAIPIVLCALVSSLASGIDLITIVAGLKSGSYGTAYSKKYTNALSGGTTLAELPNYLYGTYTGLSTVLFGLVPSLCGAFGRASLPSVSHSYGEGNTNSVKEQAQKIITLTAYISIPAGLGLSAISSEALSILFPSRADEVATATIPLTILSLSTAFLCISGAAYSILQAAGRQDIPLKITIIGTAVKLIGNLILVKRYDIIGAAAATAASYLITFILCIPALRKETGTNLSITQTFIYPLLTSISAISVGKAIEKSLQERVSLLTGTCICVCFTVIIYIITLLILDITTKNKLYRKIFEK